MKTKSGRDRKIVDITKENYLVPAGEEMLYHVKQEVKQFDRNTSRRLSVPAIQKYGKKSFESSIYDCLKQQGYTIEILHDPNEYLVEQEKKRAAEIESEKTDEIVDGGKKGSINLK